MTIELSALQQQRRDTAANWTGQNPTLLTGELGYETDTGKFKIGDGSTAWTSLSYLPIPDNNGLIPIDQLLLPAGTAAAPSLAFDANTGIYSPGADQVALATNGTGRLFVDANGKVGVGTSSPSVLLDVVGTSGSSSVAEFSYTGGNSVYLKLVNASNDLGFIGYETQDITFYNNNSETLRITSDGKLGVGTSNPDHKVQINSPLTNTLGDGHLGLAGSNVTLFSQRLSDADGNWNLDKLYAGNWSTVLTALRSNGNVGIGTTSPGFKLTIEDSTTPRIRIGDGIRHLNVDGGSSTQNAAIGTDYSGSFGIYTNGAANTRLHITSGGNVGIGNTAASTIDAVNNAGTLVVGDGTNANGITIYTSDSTSGELAFADGTSGSATQRGRIIYAHGDNSMRISTNGAEAMRIDSSGRLGLGTSSPLRSLHVAGAGDTGLMLQTTNAVDDKEIWEIQAAGDPSNHANLIFRSRTNAGTGGTEALRITNDGKVGIGATSPAVLLHLSSASPAIRFTDSDTSEYAEITQGGAITYISADRGNAGGGALVLRNGGTSERARIDSSGRLLVGTSSVVGTSADNSYYALLTVKGAATLPNTQGQMALVRGEGSAAITADEKIGRIVFADSDAGNYALIDCTADGTAGSGDYPGRLVFSTTADGASSPTERMRITSYGITSVFSSNQGFNSRISSAAGVSDEIFLGRHSATNTTDGTLSFYVSANGDVSNTNNVYQGISDIKLKENIVDANSQWDDFKAVRFRKFNFKAETGHETFTQLGVIAQELELVSPGLVTERPDRDDNGNDLGTTTKSVKYSILTKKALVALQEAMERIETLEAKVNALEGN